MVLSPWEKLYIPRRYWSNYISRDLNYLAYLLFLLGVKKKYLPPSLFSSVVFPSFSSSPEPCVPSASQISDILTLLSSLITPVPLILFSTFPYASHLDIFSLSNSSQPPISSPSSSTNLPSGPSAFIVWEPGLHSVSVLHGIVFPWIHVFLLLNPFTFSH